MEDYLEAILRLQQSDNRARVKGIAEMMKVSLPTVTSALRTLSTAGLVRHEKYGDVELTEEGQRRAELILRRHQALVRFLTSFLQLDADTAEQEACQMEHAISQETLNRLVTLMEFVRTCPRGGTDWLRHLAGRWDNFVCDRDCADCVASIKIPEQKPGASNEQDWCVLSDCEPESRAIVRRIDGQGAIRRRIADMGVTRGVPLEVERVAPLGDPLEVKVRGYHLSLRRDEADKIWVEPTGPGPGRGRRRRRGRRWH